VAVTYAVAVARAFTVANAYGTAWPDSIKHELRHCCRWRQSDAEWIVGSSRDDHYGFVRQLERDRLISFWQYLPCNRAREPERTLQSHFCSKSRRYFQRQRFIFQQRLQLPW